MHNRQGFTLVEIMITLVIAAGLLSLGLMTMRGYIPKQRLITTVSETENLLQRAQSEASSRAFWSCIMFGSASPTRVTLRMDTDNSRSCDTTDPEITHLDFKENVSLASGGGCTGATPNITTNCVIWFDTTGIPKLCGTACPGGVGAATNCIDGSYQIIFSHSKLETGTKAREIELNSGGLIQTVKPDSSNQLITSLWAHHPAMAGTGCE